MDLSEACKILNLTVDSSKHQADKAFRRLSRSCHPDRHDSEEAKAKFLKLKKAHEIFVNASLEGINERASEILEKEREEQQEAQKTVKFAYLALPPDQLKEGGEYKMKVCIREKCDECNGSMKRKRSEPDEPCFQCRGKRVIPASRGRVMHCNLCFGTGIAITSDNRCNMCMATGLIVAEKTIMCTVPANCKEGRVVGETEEEAYKLMIIVKEKTEEEQEKAAEED